MTECRHRRGKASSNENENGGRMLIQILICTTLICGFMFFRDTPICGTTAEKVAKHFINYTVNLKDTLTEITETVIPASGTIDEKAGN